MAFDEWLFGQALDDPGLVAIRLYTWQPGAITIGLNQRAEIALDWRAVGRTVVIRRATGGRAIYHDPSELTYSVVVGADTTRRMGGGGSTSRFSGVVANGLSRFLAQQGVGAEFVRRSSPSDHRPVAGHPAPCFASFARHELVSAGRKVVASAQRSIAGAVLQQGSIKISGVAGHAALPGIGDFGGGGTQFQSLDVEQLIITARGLFAAIAESLGVDWTVVEERADERVAQRATQIMTAPLGRREFP